MPWKPFHGSRSVARDRRGLARTFELCHAQGASPRERAIGPNVTELKMTREGVCKAFGLSPELLEALELSALRPGEDGAFELSDVAAALFSYGIQRARAADEKLAAVASALNDALPALQRLSTLPDHAALEGEPRERVTAELSTFFNAFAGLMARATAALQAKE
jgi:hypothetical protein